MKFSAIITGAFAALITAIPTTSPSKRLAVDVNQLNGLVFKQTDLNYLLGINKVDLTLFQTLGVKNNLNILVFEDLFKAEVFSLEQLLQFQQLNTLLAIAGSGILSTFDLSSLELGGLDLGLIANIGEVELTQYIDDAFVPQIQTVAQKVSTAVVVKE